MIEDHDDGKLLVVSESGEVDVPHVGKYKAEGKTCIEIAAELEPLLEQSSYKIATVFVQIDPAKNYTPVVNRSTQPVIPKNAEARSPEVFPPVFSPLSEHRFHVGDQIRYRVLEDQDDERILTVSERGDINFPLIGRLRVVDKTASQLTAEIKAALEKKFYTVAHVQVQLDSQATVRGKVFIYGQVKNPGVHEIMGDYPTLSRAVMSAGGLTDAADGHKIKVVRRNPREGKEEELTVNLMDVLEKGDPRSDVVLQTEDYIIVPQLTVMGRERIYIYGQVRSPGPQDPQGGELMLSTAILNAGGFSSFADGRRVKVFRRSGKTKEEREMIVDLVSVLKDGEFEKDVSLRPGDRVMVPEKFLNF